MVIKVERTPHNSISTNFGNDKVKQTDGTPPRVYIAAY